MILCKIRYNAISIKASKKWANIIFALFPIVVFFTYSCDSSTKPRTGKLIGSIELLNDTGDPLLDPVDFSDVTVALYNNVVLDTSVVRINRDYPQIGVVISQETEFDHRKQYPVKTTSTHADGTFILDGIKAGRYNVTLIKQGWGVRYIYDYEIVEGVNQLSVLRNSLVLTNHYTNNKSCLSSAESNLNMYPLVTLPATVPGEFHFLTDHTYLANQNALFLMDVTIEHGVKIIVNPGVKLVFHSQLHTPLDGERWWITSSIGFYENQTMILGTEDRFDKLHLLAPNSLIRNGKITHIQNGVSAEFSGVGFSNMRFMEGGVSVIAGGPDLEIVNCTTTDFDNRAHILQGSAEIHGSIFARNYDNLIVKDSGFVIHNNYFLSNWVGIRPVYGNTHIHHNVFSNNAYGISTVASAPLIEYNDFIGSSRFCIQTQVNYVQGPINDYSNPCINHNNFFALDQIIISILPDAHEGYFHSNMLGVCADLDATLNYWRVPNVDNAIYDGTNNDDFTYQIRYLPRISVKLPNAGIQ